MPSTRSLLLIVLAVVVMMIGVSSAGAARKPKEQGGEFVLQDSTGKVFGKVLDTNGQNTKIVFKINGILVWLDVHNPTSFDLYTGSNLIFVSSNCTGPPLIHKSFGHIQISTVVQVAPPGAPVTQGNFLFAPIPGTEHTGTAHSLLSLEGICSEGLNFPFAAFDAQFIVDLNTIFTPPFTLVGDAPVVP